jgi:hypothetical protein
MHMGATNGADPELMHWLTQNVATQCSLYANTAKALIPPQPSSGTGDMNRLVHPHDGASQ